PFPSRTWRDVTARRNPGTPAWLPEFRDGAVIRFTAQRNHLADATAPWGPYRIIYLQYASDPITFFQTDALWRKPDWMQSPIGPDVSPDLVWIPVVTFLQLAVDMMLATTTPLGYGHVYTFDHYLDGWASLTDAPGWTPAQLDDLKAKFAADRP
nr:alpha/beta-hydrolase family protein [Arenimonas sp.]